MTSHLRWRVIAQRESFTITEEAVRNGYVDINDQSLQVQTNHTAGYLLVITPSGPASSVEVGALQRNVTIGRAGGIVRGERGGVFPLTLRVLLTNDARPGDYAFPVKFSVLKIATPSS